MIVQVRGFSILELSIVLVIIGALAGGVVTGQHLIRQSELRAILDEHSRILIALNAFKVKYSAMPGDMKNATSYWGTAHMTPATCRTTISTTQATCNGDGNGILQTPPSAGSYEHFRAWQHLANAGFIKGTFTGVNSGGANWWASQPGINCPDSKVPSGGWSIITQGYYPGDAYLYSLDYGNALYFGAENTNDWTLNRILSPVELYSFDNKLDDGLPAKGTIIAASWDECTDASSNSDIDSIYDFSVSEKQCAIIFRNHF